MDRHSSKRHHSYRIYQALAASAFAGLLPEPFHHATRKAMNPINPNRSKFKSKLQYRVVWKRKEMPEKRKRYETRAGAERFATLLGPEPWKITGRGPDEQFCCSGYMCACGGITVREHFINGRENIPEIEYALIMCRSVQFSDWGEIK